MRNASFIDDETYHIGFATAAVRLLFFSGYLRDAARPVPGVVVAMV
jgi:hypothetical protein